MGRAGLAARVARQFSPPMIILKNHISKDETISFGIIIISLYLISPAHSSHETGKISHVSHHLRQRYRAVRQRRAVVTSLAAVVRQARRHALAAAGDLGNRLAQRRAAGPDTGGAVADFRHAR